MPIIHISRWKGSYDRALQFARQAAAIWKGHGATAARAGTCYSGPDTGQLYSILTFPDWATYGRAQQAIATDAEYQRLASEGVGVIELIDRSVIVAEEDL
jgi:NIPSNAP